MSPLGSRPLAGLGAHRKPARRLSGCGLLALLCLALAGPIEAQAPSDDPPRLDAVPLTPVQVAPLAPLDRSSPHEEFSPLTAPPHGQDETPTEVRRDGDWTLAQADRTAVPAGWDRWPTWAAAALVTFGVLAFLAAARLRTARPESAEPQSAGPQSAGDGVPRPLPPAQPAAATRPRGGHVFGVDVPPSVTGEPE